MLRVDPATGIVEVTNELEIGGFAAAGTQSAVSTPYQYALVVDQLGDLDGDGDVNFAEIQAGTSPIDARSNQAFSVHTAGSTALGSTASIEVATGTAWVLGFAGGLTTPMPVAGFVGELKLDLTTYQGSISGIGSASRSLPIPNLPVLAGLDLHLQAVAFVGGSLAFRNLSGVHVW